MTTYVLAQRSKTAEDGFFTSGSASGSFDSRRGTDSCPAFHPEHTCHPTPPQLATSRTKTLRRLAQQCRCLCCICRMLEIALSHPGRYRPFGGSESYDRSGAGGGTRPHPPRRGPRRSSVWRRRSWCRVSLRRLWKKGAMPVRCLDTSQRVARRLVW